MLFYIFNTTLTNNNIEIINCIATCATALFTLGAVIGAWRFANEQNKIAKRGQEIDLELRYFNHYQRLSDLLYLLGAYFDATTVDINGNTMQSFTFSSEQHDQYYIEQFNNNNLKVLQLLKNEAELCLSQDIIKLNQEIFEKANAILIKKIFVLNYKNKNITQYSYDNNTGVIENTFMIHANNKISLESELLFAYHSFKEDYLSHNGILKIKSMYSAYTRKISDIN